MLIRNVVNGYFDALERMVNELGVTENEIWNCDETSNTRQAELSPFVGQGQSLTKPARSPAI